jgi:hypothetical protein
MKRTNVSVVVLRVFLAVLFAFGLVMQILSLPGQFVPDASVAPELVPLSWALLIAAELAVVGLQVVIVCTWRLLSMVQRDRIFSEESLTWVNVIVYTFVSGWAVLVALSAYVSGFIYFTPEIRDPGIPILLFGLTLIATVLVLLLVILRALLRQATELRADMDVVI